MRTLVRCDSHRAREKAHRLLGHTTNEYYSLHRPTGTGGVFEVTPSELATLLSSGIKGVRQFKDGPDLARCWPATPLSELLGH